MGREELLAFLYKARTFFERAEDLRIRHNSLLQTYKSEIPHENPRGYIEYRPYIKNTDNRKEWKKWKGISGFLKSIGVWFLLTIYLLFHFQYDAEYRIRLVRVVEWVRNMLYQNGVTEIGEVYKVLDDGTVSSFLISNSDQYYWWDYIDLYIILIISILATILVRILINVLIANRNNQIKRRNDDIATRNQEIQQENQFMEQENRNIDKYNAGLVQKNREIDKCNEQVREYNLSVNKKVEEINRQMVALWKEMNDFIGKDQFPKEDFRLDAIDFYINEVENHRCDSIKECANAYVEAKRNQQTMEFYNDMRIGIDEQMQIEREKIQVRREQVQIGREQLGWQKISAFLQVEQIYQTMAKARAVADAVDQNTAATNRVADTAAEMNDRIKYW